MPTQLPQLVNHRPTIGIFVPGHAAIEGASNAASGGGIADWAARLGNARWQCRVLRAPVTGLRGWIDQPIDVFLIAPFGGWEEPAHLVALARSIAASRPVLVLARPHAVDQRLAALQAGADDVVDADADPREIVARLAGLLRRHRLASGRIACADLTIDLIDRRVTRAEQVLHLPLREYDLLANLARTPDRVVPRATLLRAVWRIDFDPCTNRVEVHMSRLRAKIDRGFAWPMLFNQRGEGYGIRSRPSALSGGRA